jgi:hypothetical protein
MTKKKRLLTLERRMSESNVSIRFFTPEEDGIRDNYSGRLYSREEYIALQARHPEKFFFCVATKPPPRLELTAEEVRSGAFKEAIEEEWRREEEEDAYWEEYVADVRQRMGNK